MHGVIGASRGLTYSIAAALWVCAVTSWAQNYPVKPVRYVIPFPVGTANDVVGRLLTDRLTRLWDQQVLVDNRVGGSGTVGAAYVAKSPPDGYTLLHCNIAPNAISPSMFEKLPYDQRDFAAITRIGMTPNIITVHPSTPFRWIKELVAYSKSNPGKLSYSAGVVGTSPHLAMEWLKLRMKFDVLHIPFRNAAQGTIDVISGQIPVNISNFPFVIDFVKTARLRALAITSAQRQAQLPGVPTMQESGVPDFDVTSWYGVCAPAATPAALLDKLNADITSVLRMPELGQRLTELAMPPTPTSREEFDRFIRAEIARWAQVIKEAKIPKQ